MEGTTSTQQSEHHHLSTRKAFAIWLVYTVHSALTLFVAWASIWPFRLSSVVVVIGGGLLIGVGLLLYALGILALRSFSRMSGVRVDTLMTSGIFRYSRNPQLTGWGLVLIGASLAGYSLAALLLALVFWLANHLYLVRVEEPHLAQAFGKQYHEYRARTPRYLGL